MPFTSLLVLLALLSLAATLAGQLLLGWQAVRAALAGDLRRPRRLPA